MQVNELFKQSNTILLDGGMGTMLQAAGLKLGARPEELNITDPALIEGIHGQYAAAGSRIVNANTFGASAHKLAGSTYTLEQVITAGIENCKRACAPYGALTALDVGPLGELLEPSGTLAFEDAVAEYARIVKAGEAAGADLIFFETYTDLYELKAALLAAKENTHLPILASMSFEAGGRTFTGCTVESFAATARGLGADAVGINCSLGPKEIFPMAKRLAEAVPGNFPVFVKPNAGLPRADGSCTYLPRVAVAAPPQSSSSYSTVPLQATPRGVPHTGCPRCCAPRWMRSRWTASRWWASASTPPAKSASSRHCGKAT